MSEEFFSAIKRGDKDEVERRLMLDPILIHAKENGLSPILVAAYQHEPEIASFLADKTVAINIFEAAATGKINNIIRLLARNPQLVNAYAEDGFQPLGLACFFGHFDSAEYLVKAGASVNAASRGNLKVAPIQSAAAAGHPRIVKMLLEHSADPNIREPGGSTPLHAAAQNGDEEMIRILLYGGADLTLTSNDGKTALDLAMEGGHERATLLLGEGITKRFMHKRD
ncbi:MAG TPA: ankyrin repeat domain-containing protein [Anaerolineales bacterium]|nr:ankyrin repeat domain-containing protein [Anaerolineales bacterium]